MRAYLLGKLPDSEAFAHSLRNDGRLNDGLQFVESNLVDAYAAGGLSAKDRALFEGNYLVDEERRAKVDFAAKMLELAARDRRHRLGWLIGSVAMTALLAGATAVYLAGSRTSSEFASIETVPNERSDSASMPAHTLDNRTVLIVRVATDGSMPKGAEVRAKIDRIGDGTILRVNLGRVSERVEIPLPSGALEAGDYLVTLESGEAWVQESRFRVSR